MTALPEEEESYTFPADVEAADSPDAEHIAWERAETRAELEELLGDSPAPRGLPTKGPWAEADLDTLLAGNLVEQPPELMRRADGKPILYRGKVSGIAGPPESAKGWFAIEASRQALGENLSVVYVDFEDSATSILNRMRQIGVSDQDLKARFHLINPTTKLGTRPTKENINAGWRNFVDVLQHAAYEDFRSAGLGLVVLDGITQALANEELDPNKNEQVVSWISDVPRFLAGMKARPAVLLVDHITKAAAEDAAHPTRYATGAGSKLAAIDGAQFMAKVEQSFAAGRTGYTKISVTKDRPGRVRSLAAGTSTTQTIAEMRLDSPKADGSEVHVTLGVPDLKIVDGKVDLTKIKEEITKVLTKARNPKNRTDIYSQVTGKTETKMRALNEMIDDNLVQEVQRPGRGKSYELKKAKDHD